MYAFVSMIRQAKWLINVYISLYRNSENSQRSPLDLCVVLFRTTTTATPTVGALVKHSKRQVRGFVGCHAMLEPGAYIAVCLAFNHWHTGERTLFCFATFVMKPHHSLPHQIF